MRDFCRFFKFFRYFSLVSLLVFLVIQLFFCEIHFLEYLDVLLIADFFVIIVLIFDIELLNKHIIYPKEKWGIFGYYCFAVYFFIKSLLTNGDFFLFFCIAASAYIISAIYLIIFKVKEA